MLIIVGILLLSFWICGALILFLLCSDLFLWIFQKEKPMPPPKRSAKLKFPDYPG